MCKFFPEGDIEIEERPPRRVNEPRRTRLSFVRPTTDRSSPRHSGEVEVYRRPRSNETIVINHPREYEQPPITLESYPVPPAAPNPPHPNAWHGHHHHPNHYYPGSGSSGGGIYRTGSHPRRHSRTPSSYDSHDPIVQIIESSPEPRSPTSRPSRHGSRVITTTSRRNNRETRYIDNGSDRDSFVERRQHRRQGGDADDDRDSWTEEIVPVTRRVTGRRRDESRVRRRLDP